MVNDQQHDRPCKIFENHGNVTANIAISVQIHKYYKSIKFTPFLRTVICHHANIWSWHRSGMVHLIGIISNCIFNIYMTSRKGSLDLKAIYPWAKPVWNSNEGSTMSGVLAPGATRYQPYCSCPGDLVTLWQGQYSLVSWYFIWFHLYLNTESKCEAFWPLAQLGAINWKTHNTNQGL